MDKQFTASEVRELSRKMSAALVDMDARPPKDEHVMAALDAFADLLEAREKAVPVGTILTREPDEGYARIQWADDFHFPEDTKLYTHPSPADAERLAEALRNLVEASHYADAPDEHEAAEAALAAHSAQAQPPATSVPDAMVIFEVVSGVEGPCLTISRKADGKPRHAYRLAGPKPWGGGNTTHSFKVHTRELQEQIDAIEAVLAAQENPNG